MTKAKTSTAKKTVKKVEKKEEGEFIVVLKFNDKVFEFNTDNIQEVIKSVAPQSLKTKVVVQVTKGGKTLERVLFGSKAKMLFQNRYTLDAFVRNLFF
jgi:hypothetical protein